MYPSGARTGYAAPISPQVCVCAAESQNSADSGELHPAAATSKQQLAVKEHAGGSQTCLARFTTSGDTENSHELMAPPAYAGDLA